MITDPSKSVRVEFYLINCGVCQIPHYIPESKYIKVKEGADWYCPNGHNLVFAESELQKEKKRREWAEKSRDDYQKYWREEERRRIALKGVNTKLKNRIASGVCPCCQRSFQNLKNHIKTKHPEFKK